MVFQNNVLSGAGGSGTTVYEIDQSIRFNEADSPYMQKTYSGDGSRTTWSFSFWTKLGKSPPYNSTRGNFLIAYNTTSGAQEDIRIEGSNQQLQWFTHNDGGTGTLADLKTTQYLRDHSAWYHILCVADRTNVVSSERQRMYINGQRVTDFATETYPSQSAEGHVGKSADVHYIGSRGGNSNTRIDGYMAEIHYLDGLAYDPSFFGEFNNSGIWIAKEYTGSYGTNGFKIDGRDASDLGDDESGNGNDFTSYNLAAHDQVSDSPSNNFCVMSPIDFTYNTIKNGNLETIGGNNNKGGRGTMGFTSGKFYWEMLATTLSDRYPGSGVVYDEYASSMPTAYAGGGTNHGAGASHNGAKWYKQSTSGTQYGSHPSSGDIYMYALDRDNNKIFWGVNGTWRNSGDPANGTGAVASSLTHYGAWMPFVNHGSNAGASASTFNFGQDGTFAGAKTAQGNSDGNGVGNFYYSVPSGYLALCTKNLGS